MQEFINVFSKIAPHKHRYDVFNDFITVTAISLHNSIYFDEKKENEYLQIIKKYTKDEVNQFCKSFAIVVNLSNPSPQDILGEIYMELELGNKNNAQFFTPSEVSRLMSEMIFNEAIEKAKDDFIKVSDPACGAGSTLLACINTALSNGINPSQKVWVQAIDLDRLSALMCYIQMTLWHVPAEIIVGNTLTLEFREYWYTPSHIMGNWARKIEQKNKTKTIVEKGQLSLF